MALKARGGFWQFRMKIDGKRKRISTGIPVRGQQELKLAKRRASEIENEIRAGTFGWNSTAATIAQWWADYEKTYSRKKSKRTAARDAQMMVHILAFFGPDRSLDDVQEKDCYLYLEHRRQATHANPHHKEPREIAEGTIQRERSFAQAFWTKAIKNKVATVNPWKEIKRIPYEVRDRLLLPEEQTKLLAKLSPRFQRFALFLLGSGVRLDECRGIDPKKHIHWDRLEVTVTGKFGKTRDVPIDEDVAHVLKAQLEADGKLWTQNQQRLREVLANAARKAGIEHLGPHTLRHTFGWRYLTGAGAKRGDIYELSKILGHASVAVTERHYAHLRREDLRAARQRVDLGISASVKAFVTGEKATAAKVVKFGAKK